MALSWNEIKSRAITFSKEWENETSEHAEAKSFWDGFFEIFGISRRRVATFESKVTKENRNDGFIDLLWKGNLLVEHKSGGKNLDRAYQQAIEYFPGLKEHELPKYILVCNFQTFRLYDLEEQTQYEFFLKDLVKNVQHFAFIAGYQKRLFKEEDPVNIKAAELMGKLHDKLAEIGYHGHHLEVFLVRLLFCLFADDTSIFEKGSFEEYIDQKTHEDGSDLAAHLAQIFEVLNTPKEKRLKNLDELLDAFPFVNGKLFEEHLPTASFDSAMRKILLECSHLDWGKISPAIFGSLFQSVMNPEERRHLGAHYTSEKNILKLIKPLFLDDLWKEFEAAKGNPNKLGKFHDKISMLRFLDPACGCGNFLVITYRELRFLEIEIIKTLLFKHMKIQQGVSGYASLDISHLIKIDVDRFYGIEYEEFPAQIAQVALWLIDHQMNMQVSEIFGEYYVRLPLKKSAVIVNENALRLDWQSLIDPLPWEKKAQRFDFILGNPPFIGKQHQNTEQKADMELIWSGVKGAGVLDYVSCWYIKAAQYLDVHSANSEEKEAERTKVAFVSTNSIAQGEQVGILWNELFNKHKIKIHFAHRTFSWSNEARGKAAVHVVIIGFSNFDISEKRIFEYEQIKGEPHETIAKNINPYLVEGKDIWINKRRNPICSVPEMNYGSMPNDGGNLLLNESEKSEIIQYHPGAIHFIRKFVMGEELINNIPRYCLWLQDIKPEELRKFPIILKRVEAVKLLREKSTRLATNELAHYPTRFGEVRQPKSDYIALPRVSSENRNYIPIAILPLNTIAGDKVYTIENSSMYYYGVLFSKIHMDWMRLTCGRLKSDYSYSNQLTYNNFPWPENPTEKQVSAIEKAAQHVLDVRAEFPESSLADLYDPLSMPPKLVRAHQQLDKTVDLAYRPQPFTSEAKRIEFLFELYEKYTTGLFVPEKKKRPKK